MLIVTAYVEVKEGKTEEFIKKTEELVAETRREEGNISYTLLQDTANRNKFTFLEQWRAKKDLDEHMETPHFKAFGAFSAELAAGPADIKVFDANPFQ